jgi:hypothetical protein
MKTYRSKVDKWFPVSLFSILIVTDVTLTILGAWPAVAIISVLIILLVHLFRNTNYTLTDDKLIIKCGWLYKKEVPLQSIRKIMRTYSFLSSPALSMDKLLIFFDRQQVMISPENQEDFLLEIKTRNPSINI